MPPQTTDLLPEAVAPRLRTQRLGRAYVLLPSCASTNDEISLRAAAGDPEGTVVVAEQQSQGRGRRGRAWHSPAGENLYCSLLLRPPLPARLVAPLTLLTGAALAKAVSSLGFPPRLKWPNDVLIETPAGLRKAGGILAETSCEGERVRHVVVGVGVNVNGMAFPDSLQGIATSLRMISGRDLDRGELLAAFLNAMEPLYDGFLAAGPSAGLDEWSRHAQLGQTCSVLRGTEPVEGVAVGVDAAGALLLRTASGETVPVHAGEVEWRAARPPR